MPLIKDGRELPFGLDYTAWLTFDQIYPQQVYVGDVDPDSTTDGAAGEPQLAGCWDTRRLDVWGWGSAIWGGLTRADGRIEDTGVVICPDPGLIEEVYGLMMGRMLNLDWMPPARAAQLGVRRVERMLYGLSVFVYRTAPVLFGGRWPVGDSILSLWQNSEGVPVICQSAGLDLRALETY